MTYPSTARNELTRHAAAADLIGRARVTAPSRENALRLLAAYERVYCSDDELYRRATNPAPDQGIDGLTEPMTVVEFQRLLALPDSVTVEIPGVKRGHSTFLQKTRMSPSSAFNLNELLITETWITQDQ